MKENVQKKSVGMSIPSFNLIAMKDIKDKTTRKGSLKPLFDCVESFSASVDSLHEFLRSNPEDKDAALINNFLSHLTDMQVKLLELCQEKVKIQNRFDAAEAVNETSAQPQVEQKSAKPVQPATDMTPPRG